MTGLLLAAVVIVRDEAEMLPACLDSLAGVADVIRVHDTGSQDGTPEIAARHGAVVTHGAWTDDFAAARNEAVRGETAEWVLALDADHRVIADPGRLRELLTTTRDVLRVEVDDAHHASPYRQLKPASIGRGPWNGRAGFMSDWYARTGPRPRKRNSPPT